MLLPLQRLRKERHQLSWHCFFLPSSHIHVRIGLELPARGELFLFLFRLIIFFSEHLTLEVAGLVYFIILDENTPVSLRSKFSRFWFLKLFVENDFVYSCFSLSSTFVPIPKRLALAGGQSRDFRCEKSRILRVHGLAHAQPRASWPHRKAELLNECGRAGNDLVKHATIISL